MSHSIDFDANSHDVDTVTVYQTNRAEVVRKIKVELRDGQNAINVKNLPSCIAQDSIRVEGTGKAVIFDVIYHSPPSSSWDPRRPKDNESVNELNKARSKVEAKQKILERQATILREYSRTLNAEHASLEQVEAFLDKYSARQDNIDEALAKLQEEREQIDKDIASARINANADEVSVRERGVVITVIVLGQGDGEAELSLTYVVSNASWTPQYDLRASIPVDESGSTVTVDYRAAIMQRTGENWSGVALKLSTASPLQGTTVPSLAPHRIDDELRVQRRHSHRSRNSRTRFLDSEAEVNDEEDEECLMMDDLIELHVVNDPPPIISVRTAVAQDGAIGATFNVSGLSTIPSGSSSGSETHKVSLAEIEAKAVELEWITVPQEIPNAFLRCHVKNTSDFVLLPGEANVFMNNKFVAKSRVPLVSAQERFTCSLGVDPAIRVTYHSQNKRRKTSASMFSSKNTSTTFEQRISIKNTRLTPVLRLIVRDQVPVSDDGRIKVKVIDPALLNDSGAQETRIKEGVVARWAQQDGHTDDTPTGTKDLGPGLLEWICEVPPASTINIDVSWEVSAPNEVTWVKH